MGPLSGLLLGYGLAIAVEVPILVAFLSRRFSVSEALLAGVWLQTCTYPVVAWVFPCIPWLAQSPALYFLVAETFAPLAEALLLYLCLQRHRPRDWASNMRDYSAVVLANAASFVVGLAAF